MSILEKIIKPKEKVVYKEVVKDVDIKDLVREIFKSIKPKQLDWHELSRDEQEKIQDEAHLFVKSKLFKLMFEKLCYDQMKLSMYESRDDKEFNMGRMTINGFEIVKQELEYLSSLHEDRLQKSLDKYNENDII